MALQAVARSVYNVILETLKIISHPELHRLRTWHLLIAEEIPHQLQFRLLEEFTFYGNNLADAY